MTNVQKEVNQPPIVFLICIAEGLSTTVPILVFGLLFPGVPVSFVVFVVEVEPWLFPGYLGAGESEGLPGLLLPGVLVPLVVVEVSEGGISNFPVLGGVGGTSNLPVFGGVGGLIVIAGNLTGFEEGAVTWHFPPTQEQDTPGCLQQCPGARLYLH